MSLMKPLFVLMLLWPGFSAVAEEQASLPLSKLYNKYDAYLEMPADTRREFFPRYKLLSKLVDPGTVKLHFTFAGERHEIRVDEQGYLLFFPSAMMLKVDPMVYLDQPKGSMGISLAIGFKMGDALEYDARQLHARAHKGFKAAKSLGGFMALFAPSHSNLRLGFGPACKKPKAIYALGGIEIDLMHETELSATVPFKKHKKMRKKGLLKFSCKPVFAELG